MEVVSPHRFRRTCLGGMITILILVSHPAYVQDAPNLFAVFGYMKVPPGKSGEYIRVEQELWKPMHSERVRAGKIVGWYLYTVDFSGDGDEYNYVVINVYRDLEGLENPWAADIPPRVHPDKDAAEIMEETNRSRQAVRSELVYRVISAPEVPLERPAPYLQVNFMQVEPGGGAEYEALETEIWQRIHNESIQSGSTSGWGLWSVVFPRGANRPYQYITMNAFSEYTQIFPLDFSKAFERAYPEKNYDEAQQRTQKARTIVRTELWELLDYAVK